MTTSDPLVWVDCEMTGLDLGTDALLEVAVVVTDYDLSPLAEGIDVLIRPPEEALRTMSDHVRTMHTSSGLLEELRSGLSLDQARSTVMGYIRTLVPDPGTAQLAGNSVGTDKSFLARDMPELVNHLHYRIVDVSSIKELAKRWYPRTFFHAPDKVGGHRALADVLESIDELRYYRSILFPQGEGPSSEECKAAAAAVTASPTSRVRRAPSPS
ncbi:oligoribonuclease [Actinomyces sp. 2119]|uniref:Oligoribonuclease n=1 Tax=Actinomyces lilanjuaniae TaxID=2321394 RepID=A0ABM6Z4L3_9ACTO|nr:MULTISPECIES: oligoribonuclease [Actinomyces]AYD90098.1 oligoribonuclease [Actinomyces lilanjuaniae]RJF42606.1 oligoribonuclease [Actinomyces sp. 2119]